MALDMLMGTEQVMLVPALLTAIDSYQTPLPSYIEYYPHPGG